jgi:hypothetical protein
VSRGQDKPYDAWRAMQLIPSPGSEGQRFSSKVLTSRISTTRRGSASMPGTGWYVEQPHPESSLTVPLSSSICMSQWAESLLKHLMTEAADYPRITGLAQAAVTRDKRLMDAQWDVRLPVSCHRGASQSSLLLRSQHISADAFL